MWGALLLLVIATTAHAQQSGLARVENRLVSTCAATHFSQRQQFTSNQQPYYLYEVVCLNGTKHYLSSPDILDTRDLRREISQNNIARNAPQFLPPPKTAQQSDFTKMYLVFGAIVAVAFSIVGWIALQDKMEPIRERKARHVDETATIRIGEGIAIFITVILTIFAWGSLQGFFTILLAFFAIGLFGILILILLPELLLKIERAYEKRIEAAERQREHEAYIKDLITIQKPDVQTFEDGLRYECRDCLPEPYFSHLIDLYTAIYRRVFHPPELMRSEQAGQDGMRPYRSFFQACAHSLKGFASALPPDLKKSTATDTFTETLTFEFTPDQLQRLARPLHIRNFGYLNYPDSDPPSGAWDQIKHDKGLAKLWENAYSAFLGTPFSRYIPEFLTMTYTVPIEFSRAHRFRHMFIVGPTGAGKTTLISHFIRDALEEVKNNNASLFLMDSQNELIPWIAKQKRFAPGGDLHGKLIYLEPSVEHPLALNIFDFSAERLDGLSADDQQTVMGETVQMVNFFMDSFVGSEASGFATGITNYAVRALRKIPNSTIEHFQQLLEKGGFQHLATQHPQLNKLAERDIKFLTTGMFDQQASLTALRNRLNIVMSDDRFTTMFLHKNRFDLYDKLGSSKVILVNAMEGRLLNTREAFGRFFIAKLVYAMMRRSLDKGYKQDCYVFIDEAQDYLRRDRNIEQLQQKARKQNMALHIATHKVEDFDPPVLSSLRQFAIQMWGEQEPIWNVTVPAKRDVPAQITVPPFSFKNEPQMADEDWEDILRQMRKDFCYTPQPAAATTAAATASPVAATEEQSTRPSRGRKLG